jgi:uncharacterized Zn-binding protein involved in type VI secretion
MPAVQRVGDQDAAGGVIQQGDTTVLVNGQAVAIPNMPVSSHPPYGKNTTPHHQTKTKSSQNSTVFVNGQPVIVTGDTDTCGHPRVGGSPDVTIG